MQTAILLASPGATYLTRLGNNYTADESGVIRNVPLGTEVQDLQSSGCNLVQPGRYPLMAMHANMNTLDDQSFDASLIGAARFMPDKVVASRASIPMTAAVGGVYTRNEKGGDKLASITFAALDGTDENQAIVIVVDPAMAAKAQHGSLWFTLDTVQGEESTCTIYVYGDLVAV